jgi:hypothetical protein
MITIYDKKSMSFLEKNQPAKLAITLASADLIIIF